MANKKPKVLTVIFEDGNSYTIRGLSDSELSKLQNALVASDIAGKLDSTLKGVANGLAELDANGKVPSSQLPSYVDDVIEGNSILDFPATGESDKIYVDLSENKTYRWSGSDYVEISSSLALGETSGTAYRGDRGKTAYDHANAKGSAYSSGLYKITTNNQGHVTAAEPVEKQDITGLGIPGSDTTYSNATQSADGLMSSTDKIKLDGLNGLPAVTSSDNGKVLRVVSGAWAVATLPAASGVSF